MLEDGVNMRHVLWTAEKRFNLNGPDFYCSFWHDLRKEVPQRLYKGDLAAAALCSGAASLQAGFAVTRESILHA